MFASPVTGSRGRRAPRRHGRPRVEPGGECRAGDARSGRRGAVGGGEQERPKASVVTQNPIGYGEKNAMPSPTQVTATAISDRQRQPDGRAGGQPGRGGGRGDEQREDQQAAGDLAGAGRGDAEQHQERRRQQPDRHARGRAATSGSMLANSSGRPSTSQHEQAAAAGDEQGEDLVVGDAGDGAEQQVVQPGQETLVEADEQEPAGQREGLHGADDRRLLAVAAEPAVSPGRRRAARR